MPRIRKEPPPKNTAEHTVRARGIRRAWSAKLGPAQIRVLANRYYGGQNTPSLLSDFGISRSSLFRYLKEYADMPDKNKDMAWVLTENGRLVSLVSKLVLQLEDLKAENARLTSLEAG